MIRFWENLLLIDNANLEKYYYNQFRGFSQMKDK